MIVLALFTTGALAIMLIIAAANAVALPRLCIEMEDGQEEREPLDPVAQGGAPAPPQLPSVSILIPARNEAANIADTLQALLVQDYPCFEVLVLDDHSQDETARIAQGLAAGDPRLRVLPGAPLPDGWIGKPWACHQLAQVARHELLIFSDADVHWRPGALRAAVALQQQSQADLLTIWPTQITITWGERLVVPLMALAVLAYLPIWLAHHTPYALAAAANGQCMIFQRRAYQESGGHAAVRHEIIEDVRLAQRIKKAGLRLRMADGNGLIQARMYRNWAEVRSGYAKNILAGHWNSPLLLFFSTLFHLLVFVGPWVWFGGWVIGWPRGHPGDWGGWAAMLIFIGIGVRGLTAAITRQRLRDSWLMPISALLMTWISGQALWWRWRKGGAQWKGRVIRNT